MSAKKNKSDTKIGQTIHAKKSSAGSVVKGNSPDKQATHVVVGFTPDGKTKVQKATKSSAASTLLSQTRTYPRGDFLFDPPSPKNRAAIRDVEPARRTETGARRKAGETDFDRAIAAMAARRTPAQVAAAQAQAIDDYPAERALPTGSTLFDAIGGQWPGDESDEEIAAALSRLS